MADDEISLGRIGDALLNCEQARGVAAGAYETVREVLGD